MSFLVIVLFPIMIFSAFSYNRLTDLIKANYNKDNMGILNSLDRNLEVYLEEYSRITANAFLSNSIQSILNNDDDNSVQRLKNQWLFDDYVITVCSDRSDVESVYLVSNSGYIYSNGNAIFDAAGKEWFGKIRDGNGSFVIAVSFETVGFFTQERYFIHIGREIRDLYTNKPLGVFFINLNYRKFINFMPDLEIDDRRNIIIHDQDSLIVFDRNESNITTPFDSAYPELIGDIDGKEIVLQNEKTYILTMPSRRWNWTYIETIQVKSLYEQINRILLSILWAALGCFAVYLIAAFLISRKIINPWVYETRLKELGSEFRALQAQINPHFLYNTLESINCLAQIKNENEISEMIRGLARMFRYSGAGNKEVILEDEVIHVKDYIFLQAFRYEDKFSIEYAIPEELLQTKVLRLMLQPLVENAIHHGIEKIPGKGYIRISACRDGNIFIIELRDNGKGIEKEKLEADEFAELFNQ